MQLAEVMAGAVAPGAARADVEVTALAYDNRAVTPGTLFFCVPGFTRDGHDFAPDAVARGASALVVARELAALDVAQVRVDDVRAAMAPAAAAFHGDPTAALAVVGVTGTNGKTTSAYLVRALLEAGGRRTGLLGTVASVVGGVETEAVRTTPEAIDLQRTFADMLAGGDTHAVMEVSSHALELHRADAIRWAVAIFTNLTQDHLDFHPTMEAYFAAKAKLFAAAAAQGAPRVVNVDDRWGARLAAEHPDATTISLRDATADLHATDVRSTPAAAAFTLDGARLSVPAPGEFNVLNALGAIAAARALGVADEAIARGLATAAMAPGRFQAIDEGQDFAVVVDYSHKPDALENVLRAARPMTAGRVIVLFGAGGDRDRGKRPLMGAAARDGADVVIVTSDNPRSEDPEAIIAEILPGAGPDAEVIVDRRDAIERAIALARPGDTVLLAGKGHETYQEVGGVKRPFDDALVAREALRARLVA